MTAKKDYVIPLLALIMIIALLIHGPIPQDQHYHGFADQRKAFAIPNFLNVITNLPFALVGLLGLRVVARMTEKWLSEIAGALFTGFVLLSAGSGYFHLLPNNTTLIYDRIPMSIIFMSFFAFIIHDRIEPNKGYIAFLPLNVIGMLSVLYWAFTEYAGRGDLRLYAMVQFFPVIAIPLILFLYKCFFNHAREIVAIFILFGMAKVAENFDQQIYEVFKHTISGHSIKHLLMAAAGYGIVKLMERRTKVVYSNR